MGISQADYDIAEGYAAGRKNAELELQGLYEALKAAAYYIERLELVQQRRRVRDMTEAMEYYHRVAVPVLAAYESAGGV